MALTFNTKLRPAGTIIIGSLDGDRKVEVDTWMCCHCGQHCARTKGIWTAPSQTRKPIRRGFCMRCNGPTCGKYSCDACVPTERKLELCEAGAKWNEIGRDAAALPVSVPVLWTPPIYDKGV